ncbi:hypothetical protein BP6252_07465 [Coleophoma cylindrospora]|uniref:DUF5672 domain-containing protein n=1 Tax=Coleophoma cylindrospora TaxID=1849047 RepID=A0A3D8RI04_9HELO|nr:hypothetical protein BP6252_07465 [Coleophoma cylindrospora]
MEQRARARPRSRFTDPSVLARQQKNLLGLTPSGDTPVAASPNKNVYGHISNKVAVITDTQYTPRLIPLILHYHSVLGPDWPIVFYTSQETITQHLDPNSKQASAIWSRAVQDGRIEVRTIPDEFNLTSRDGVNIYLSRPWLWESLAPAQHVLIFQTDAIVCANAHRSIDDFLEWDWIGAPLHATDAWYNGGLSLRNRTMILDILREGNNWETETQSGAWTFGGEDAWFSRKMDARGAHLPPAHESLQFACEFDWHVDQQKEPFGYHKIHKNAPGKLDEIIQWCPEITLAAAGKLAD